MIITNYTLKHYKTIDSTNDEAIRLFNSGCTLHKCVLLSDEQTNGHGRLDRTFSSPPGGLYFSLVYLKPLEDVSLVTASAAVFVTEALKSRGFDCAIKWVNDVLLKKGDDWVKVSGILTKGVTGEDGTFLGYIIGIGVDIKFSGLLDLIVSPLIDFLDTASLECGQKRDAALESIMARYNDYSMLIGRTVTAYPLIGGTPYSGKALAIKKNAHLLIELIDGTTKELNSGEVTLHPPPLSNRLNKEI